jgi:hypothetical protein
MYSDAFDLTYKNYTELQFKNTSRKINPLLEFDQNVFDNRLTGKVFPYRYGSFFIYEANNLTKQFKVAIFLNLTS